MAADFDIAIVGGGLVGASLACALDGLGYAVVQLEAQPPRVAGAPAWDERSFALARNSVQALDELGVWRHARGEATPITAVHVSSRGDFGVVRIRAADYGLESLGHTVPARAVGAALEARSAELRALTRIAPARLVGFEHDTQGADLRIEREGSEQRLRVRLLVGADGTDSFVRSRAGIGTAEHDYGQCAIVTTVATSRPHAGVAYERFTASGPMAMLPLSGERCGLVWTVPAGECDPILALDDEGFLAAASERFGSRLGRLRRAGARQLWPLRRVEAHAIHAPRLVLVGNAAQTIHPIGAQGFNLGVRDVQALRDALRSCAAQTGDPGAQATLEAYARARKRDRETTARASDAMVRWFAPEGELLRIARGLSLAAVERMPWVKRELAFAMMGYRGAPPSIPSHST